MVTPVIPALLRRPVNETDPIALMLEARVPTNDEGRLDLLIGDLATS
jgi:hypothetical protein